MASPARANYAHSQWHEITPGSVWTQLTHNAGDSSVVYTEAASEPTAYNPESSATNATTVTGHNVYFNNLTPGDNIYFWPLNSDAEITVTKAGV